MNAILDVLLSSPERAKRLPRAPDLSNLIRSVGSNEQLLGRPNLRLLGELLAQPHQLIERAI